MYLFETDNQVPEDDRNARCSGVAVLYGDVDLNVVFDSTFTAGGYFTDLGDAPDHRWVLHEFGRSLSNHLLTLVNFNLDHVWDYGGIVPDFSFHFEEDLRCYDDSSDMSNFSSTSSDDEFVGERLYTMSLRSLQHPYYLAPVYYPTTISVSPVQLHSHLYSLTQFYARSTYHPFNLAELPPLAALRIESVMIHVELLSDLPYKRYRIRGFDFALTSNNDNQNGNFSPPCPQCD